MLTNREQTFPLRKRDLFPAREMSAHSCIVFLFFFFVVLIVQLKDFILMIEEISVTNPFNRLHSLNRPRFFGRIRKRICDPRSYGFFDIKETQNPKKGYFVLTRQAGGTQYIYIYIYTR